MGPLDRGQKRQPERHPLLRLVFPGQAPTGSMSDWNQETREHYDVSPSWRLLLVEDRRKGIREGQETEMMEADRQTESLSGAPGGSRTSRNGQGVG